jgi:serine phosphatase RsbU (regulator of sigma subunit)
MRRPYTSLVRYSLGALGTALVFLLILVVKTLVQPEFLGQIASPLFLLAVVVSAWHGGKGPGLVAAFLAYLTLEYFFLHTVNSFDPGWEDIPVAAVYLVSSLVVSILEERRQRAEMTVERSEKQMRIARGIQERLWPAAPPDLRGFDIAGVSYPAAEVGGDYFDFIPMRHGRMGITLGDVSGHGFGPALLMSEVRAYLRALVLVNDDITDILTRTNDMLVKDTADDTFVTLFFACLDARNRSMIYAGAGHEAVLLHPYRCPERLRSTSVPLGLENKLHVAGAHIIRLEIDDVLLLVSDGIAEALSLRGERFGIERAINVVSRHQDKIAHEMMARVCMAVRRFSKGMPQADDQTVVIVKVKK